MSLELRRLGLAAMGIIALGCLGPGTERQARLYVLDAVVPVTEAPEIDLSLGIGPISLPERLDRPQILTRAGEFEVEISEFERWAEPLEESFASVLAEDVSRAIPTDRVGIYPWNRTPPVALQVTAIVTRFEREQDDSVTLAVRWRVIEVNGRKVRLERNDSYREPAGTSTEEMVAAMSRAVAAFAQDIATAVRSEPPSTSRE